MFTPIGELKNRKAITNPITGHSFEIRPVFAFELWKSGVYPQGAPGSSEQDIKKILETESADDRAIRIAKMEAVLITRGITSVKIVERDAAEDELLIDDLDPDDRAFCLIELCAYSGLTRKSDRQEGTFRPDASAGSGEVASNE